MSIGIWAVVGLILAAGPVALPIALDGRFDPWSLWPALAAGIATAMAIRSTIRRRAAESILVGIAGAVLLMPPLLHFVVPGVSSMWLSRSVAQIVQTFRAEQHGWPERIAAVGYHEPSLVFLLGTRTELTSPEGAVDFLAQHPESLLVVGNKEEPSFKQKAAEAGVLPRQIGSIRGFNYSKGRKTTLSLFTGASAPMQSIEP